MSRYSRGNFKKRAYINKEQTETTFEESSNDATFDIGKNKRVTVRKFNDINLVDIREFYRDFKTQELKPTKKGISLTEEVWRELLAHQNAINGALEDLNPDSKPKKAKTEKPEQETKESTEDRPSTSGKTVPKTTTQSTEEPQQEKEDAAAAEDSYEASEITIDEAGASGRPRVKQEITDDVSEEE